MPCPHCRSTATTTSKPRTTLGYPRFTCQACGRRFNERTGTPFNDLQHPTDIVLLAVLCACGTSSAFATLPSSCSSAATR